MKCTAPDCGREFTPHTNNAKYCSLQCKDRHKMQIRRAEREKHGLCPQCGKPYDAPMSGHHNKPHPKHCSRCQEYWRDHHKRTVGTGD